MQNEKVKVPFTAKIKEWCRKKIVGLKRKPQTIALLWLAVTSLYYLFCLSTLSPGPVKDFQAMPWLGLCVFINTLFSILALVLFLNSFPKYPIKFKNGMKWTVNWIMIALLVIFLAAEIFFDVLYYKQLLACISGNEQKFFSSMAEVSKYTSYCKPEFLAAPEFNAEAFKAYLPKSFSIVTIHIVFIGIEALLLATLPLFKWGLSKINTKVQLETTQLKEAIDTDEE